MNDFSEIAFREQAKKDGITHISTGVAILRDKKILMVRRAKDDFLGGVFELPGGGVDADETIGDSALREVREETGLMPTKVIATFDGFDYSTNKKPKVRQINFIIEVEPGTVTLSEEHDDSIWVNSKNLQSLEITNNMLVCVKNALAIIDSIG